MCHKSIGGKVLRIFKNYKETNKYQDILNKVYFEAISRINQKTADTDINLYFVTPKEIKKINSKTRNINAVTDVLSFPYTDLKVGVDFDENNYVFEIDKSSSGFLLGEIFICLRRAKKQAKMYGHSFERELCFLLVHGILHLHGYDHIDKSDEEQMIKMQNVILNKLNITR